MVWKLFQAPMAAQYKCCDEASVSYDEPSLTEDNSGSFSDLSVDIDDLLSQPDPFSEEATLPSQPVPPAQVTGNEETSSTPDMDDGSKIAKGGLSPRPRPALRKGGSVVLSRRRLRTHAPLRGNTSVEATTSGEPRQKEVPSKAPKTLPMPQDSQEMPTRREPIRKLSPPRTKERRDEPRVKIEQLQNQPSTDVADNSKKAKEATVGHRRRQCTRPLLNSRTYTMQSRSLKTMTPTAEQYAELKKMSRQDAHLTPLRRAKSETPLRTVSSASAA
jgi:hypothetical protein